MNLTLQIRSGSDDTAEVHTTQSLNDGGDITIGQCQLLHHLRIDTKLIEVFLLWIVHVGIALRNDTDNGSTLLCLLYKGLT